MPMPSQFWRCPSCGRRFGVRHTGEKLEKSEMLTKTVKEFRSPAKRGGWRYETGDNVGYIGGPIPVVEQRRQIRVEEDTYEESYVCRNCGHRWTRTRVKEKRLD
jgi:ribosomal protein L37AE/L43A